MQRGCEHAINAGRLLIEAKAQLAHGQWLPWLEDHCQVSERTAQAYMQCARGIAKLAMTNPQRPLRISPFRDALHTLAATSTRLRHLPSASRDRVLESMQGGDETLEQAVRRVHIEEREARHRGSLETPRLDAAIADRS